MLMDVNLSYEEKVKQFKEIIKESNRIVFFGGAGVSTASGIPDFRSANGLYNKVDPEFSEYSPEYYLSNQCFNHNTKLFYKFYRKFMDARAYEPNIVHNALARLEKQHKMLGIITQNIDLLHEKAGSEKVFKIHGTIDKGHCIKCHKEYNGDVIFDTKENIPHCDCGKNCNYIKPNVTLYGESLPVDAVRNAYDVLTQSDCLIIAGTSLQVEPAASMVNHFQGKYIVILNREETAYDMYADLFFREDMFQVFKDLNI